MRCDGDVMRSLVEGSEGACVCGGVFLLEQFLGGEDEGGLHRTERVSHDGRSHSHMSCPRSWIYPLRFCGNRKLGQVPMPAHTGFVIIASCPAAGRRSHHEGLSPLLSRGFIAYLRYTYTNNDN